MIQETNGERKRLGDYLVPNFDEGPAYTKPLSG
jgi:hypothetical protein